MAREGAAVLCVVVVAALACWVPPVASIPSIEIHALNAIRNSLIDPSNSLKNWGKGDPCANWTGVFCKKFSDDLHVTELRLLQRNLSGILAPEVGLLTHVTILDFLWNQIGGSIPKEVGNMTSLHHLLLSGNIISGPLPDELGNLPNITKFQLDLNYINGSLPASFANLTTIQHLHMNNNSISGQIPPGLHKLPNLFHILLDNNNLSGYLPPELGLTPQLKILQLDNNNFGGNQIPLPYANMSSLRKLSLRNCNLTGPVPDFSTAPGLLYLDLSSNNLTGSIPTNSLYNGIIKIDLSSNQLSGPIPLNFSGLPSLQNLALQNNFLTGDVPVIWQNITFDPNSKLLIDFRNNALTDINGTLNPPPNVTLQLQGNPVCRKQNIQNLAAYCGAINEVPAAPPNPDYSNATCQPQDCPGWSECVSGAPQPFYCAAPIGVIMVWRSPSISYFPPYEYQFVSYISSNLNLDTYQVAVNPNYTWEQGHRLKMLLQFFPRYGDDSKAAGEFNSSEAQRIVNDIATFSISRNDTFGPYDLINFAYGSYQDDFNVQSSSGAWSTGVKVAVVLGSFACLGVIVLAIALFLHVRRTERQDQPSRRQSLPTVPMKVEGIRGFSFADLEKATNQFDVTAQIGQGGYGKVYKGVLGDGAVVAIKRAEQGSIQGQKEFFTEIEMLSRVHHRNLVSLIGYCDEENEQMLVYEFMPNGSLHSRLLARYNSPLSYALRLRIALGAAKGILYLHTEADPPIIHRDIKANNILLDGKFNAKVSDFGISRLACSPDGDGGVTTHITTNVKGTPGYLDPEYFLNHKLTEKSDVYSLGVVFLELLTGMQPISHGRNLVREVQQACQSGLMLSVIDRRMGTHPSESVKKFMELALRCCEDKQSSRPAMLEVVRELENLSSTLPETDLSASESDSSNPRATVTNSSPLYSRSFIETSEFTGSDLVSGVIPTIRPR